MDANCPRRKSTLSSQVKAMHGCDFLNPTSRKTRHRVLGSARAVLPATFFAQAVNLK